jgi:exonuclease VII large subunit
MATRAPAKNARAELSERLKKLIDDGVSEMPVRGELSN